MVKSLEKVLWTFLKCECNLDEEHIQMAKRLKVNPEYLAECDHESLKLNLRSWIELAHGKTFGDDRSKSIIAK